MIETEEDIADGLTALGERDPRLAALIARVPRVPLRRTRADLPGLAATIVGQQVSRASAEAIFARLSSLVDLTDPEALLQADDETLRAAGLSRPKQRTLRALGEAVAHGRLDLDRLGALSPEAAVAQMVAVHGIGRWTAECHLLFAHGAADVFPAGDLALQIAAMHALALPQRPGEKALRAMAEPWAPHRAVAARLLWAFYPLVSGRKGAPVGPG